MRTTARLLVVFMLAFGFGLWMSASLPRPSVLWDYRHYFEPATSAMLDGDNPFDVKGYYSPPFLTVILAPLSFLPLNVAGALLFAANLLGFAFAFYKFRVPLRLAVAVFVVCGAWWNALLANINGLVLFGLFLPFPVGILLLSVKPQIGAVLILWGLMAAMRDKDYQEALYGVVILALSVFLPMMAYGFWPERMFSIASASWNTSLWPYSIPFGLGLFWLALKKNNLSFAMMAAVLLTPYLTWDTWVYFWIAAASLISYKIAIPNFVSLREFQDA